MKKIFKGSQSAWDKFLRVVLKNFSSYSGTVVSAKTKNPNIGRATTSFLKSKSGGKFFSLTDMHGHGLRLKKMQIISNKNL